MKKIKLIVTTFLFILTLTSCENDGGDSVRELTEGGLPDFRKTALTEVNIKKSLVNGASNPDINISLDLKIGFGDVSSMNVIGFYRKGSTTEKAVLRSNVTTFPTVIKLTKQELFDAFNVLNVNSDFATGNRLTVTAELILKDGRVIKVLNNDGTISYNSSIAGGTFPVKATQFYNVVN
jgi:hypothetical protein